MEWRSRRWRRLLNLIDTLPRNSAYVEAITQDEEWASMILADPPDKTPPRVRMSEFSPEVERLCDLVDRVTELIQTTVAVAGGRPKNVKPAPRPSTAVERVRKRRRESTHRSVVGRLLPHKAAGTPPPPTPASEQPAAAARPAGPGTQWLRQRAASKVAGTP